MKLNKIIKTNYKYYTGYVNIVPSNTRNVYIYSLYNHRKCILHAEYVLLGSFSRSKNIWIWQDQSDTLDKQMVNDISKIRSELLNKKKINNDQKDFVKKNYTIITLSELYDNCKFIDNVINGDIFIVDIETDDIIDVILFTKILHNNIEY